MNKRTKASGLRCIRSFWLMFPPFGSSEDGDPHVPVWPIAGDLKCLSGAEVVRFRRFESTDFAANQMAAAVNKDKGSGSPGQPKPTCVLHVRRLGQKPVAVGPERLRARACQVPIAITSESRASFRLDA